MEQAGPEIVRLFEGKDIEHPEITFLGPTNHSIRRYMLENDIERIADIDPDDCKDLLLQCVIDGKIYRDSVPRGRYAGRGWKILLDVGRKYDLVVHPPADIARNSGHGSYFYEGVFTKCVPRFWYCLFKYRTGQLRGAFFVVPFHVRGFRRRGLGRLGRLG